MTVIILIVLSLGCTHPVQPLHIEKLETGMPKKAVLNIMGEPFRELGKKKYADGTVEGIEYRRYYFMRQEQLDEIYWLYFYNGKFVKWTLPGDWAAEADKIYEMNEGKK